MKRITALLLSCFCFLSLSAIVRYDEGRIEVNGIQLLQDRENTTDYYYIPPYPRLSTWADGSFEFLCIKYVHPDGKSASGGLFHALVKFDLSKEEVQELQEELNKILPDAKIMGMVPIMSFENDGEQGASSFRIVSSILNPSLENPFTSKVITSGRAPFLPGSKAAIAAMLSADGATLLWESLNGGTSDISVVVEGYYEAIVEGYNAVVKADLNVVYEHFSSFSNVQAGFTRLQTRQAIDSMAQNGTINIEIFDRSKSLGFESGELQKIVDLVTEKIVAIMFDVKSGWAKMPEAENAIKSDDVPGRYQRGGFVRFFMGDGSQPYKPDNQFLLKTKKEIRNFSFFFNLSQSTVIKVPIYSAGNIRGFYELYKDDLRYFKIVNLDDPDFQNRELHFQIDGDYLESYGDLINFASVNVRKHYGEEDEPFTADLIFKKEDVNAGQYMQSVSYPRLGLDGEKWRKYNYQTAWSIIGKDTILRRPVNVEEWLTSNLPVIPLRPPFEQRTIDIDADRSLFEDSGIRTATVRFASVLFGETQKRKTIVLRANDDSDTARTTIYHDNEQAIVYQVTWYSNTGKFDEELQLLEGEYIFLVPPSKEMFLKN